jgi:hypothetical protein
MNHIRVDAEEHVLQGEDKVDVQCANEGDGSKEEDPRKRKRLSVLPFSDGVLASAGECTFLHSEIFDGRAM